MQACITQLAKKFKKVQAKKLVKLNNSKNFLCEIAIFELLNFFQVQKMIFAIFEIAKNGIWSK